MAKLITFNDKLLAAQITFDTMKVLFDKCCDSFSFILCQHTNTLTLFTAPENLIKFQACAKLVEAAILNELFGHTITKSDVGILHVVCDPQIVADLCLHELTPAVITLLIHYNIRHGSIVMPSFELILPDPQILIEAKQGLTSECFNKFLISYLLRDSKCEFLKVLNSIISCRSTILTYCPVKKLTIQHVGSLFPNSKYGTLTSILHIVTNIFRNHISDVYYIGTITELSIINTPLHKFRYTGKCEDIAARTQQMHLNDTTSILYDNESNTRILITISDQSVPWEIKVTSKTISLESIMDEFM